MLTYGGKLKAFVIATVMAGAVPGSSPIAVAQGAKAVPIKCLAAEKNSKAVRADGRIRFLLHSPILDFVPGDTSHSTIAVEPERLPLQDSVCGLTKAPNGAFAVDGILVRFEGGPRYSGRFAELGQAGTVFNAYIGSIMPHVLRDSAAFEKRQGGLVPRGRMFGLDRYQHAYGIKDGKPTAYTSYLGAIYIGATPAGHFVKINCVDFEIGKDISCQLQIEARERVALSFILPTENIAKWAEYSAIIEKYFEAHVE